MTGSFEFFLISAGAHTLRNKQSSEDVFEIESAPPRGNAACGQSAQNLFASRTPCHAFAGCGGRQRYSPTGGAAYGIPLKLETFPTVTPRNDPELVCTRGPEVDSFCAFRTNDNSNVDPKNNFFIMTILLRYFFYEVHSLLLVV